MAQTTALTAFVLVAVAISSGVPAAQSNAEADLKQVIARWQEAMTTGNIKAMATLMTSDVVGLHDAARPAIGRVANVHVWQAYYQRSPTHPTIVDSLRVSASGDMAYVLGRFLLGRVDDPKSSGGHFLAVWRRSGNQWLLASLGSRSYDSVTGATFRTR